MERVPRDVVTIIMEYLGSDRLNFLLTCKSWYAIGRPALEKWYFRQYALQWAVSNGNTKVIYNVTNFSTHLSQMVEELVQDPQKRVSPNFWNNWSLLAASEYGFTDIVRLLLKDDRVNPADGRNKALTLASKKGHVQIVQQLLQMPNVTSSGTESIKLACKGGHLQVLKLLLEHRLQTETTQSLQNEYLDGLKLAVEEGHADVVKYLVTTLPIRYLKWELIKAVSIGKVDVVKALLAGSYTPEPQEFAELIQEATWRKFDNVKEVLQSHQKSKEDEKTKEEAKQTLENKKVVENTAVINTNPLSYPKVAEMVKESMPHQCTDLRSIAKAADVKLINRLLDEGEMPPQAIGKLFQALCTYSPFELVQQVIKHQKIDPAYQQNYALRLAADYGRADVVRLLMDDPRVDLSVQGHAALMIAISNKHVAVVRELLKDPRIDPTEDNNSAVYKAHTMMQEDILKELQKAVEARQTNK